MLGTFQPGCHMSKRCTFLIFRSSFGGKGAGWGQQAPIPQLDTSAPIWRSPQTDYKNNQEACSFLEHASPGFFICLRHRQS